MKENWLAVWKVTIFYTLQNLRIMKAKKADPECGSWLAMNIIEDAMNDQIQSQVMYRIHDAVERVLF